MEARRITVRRRGPVRIDEQFGPVDHVDVKVLDDKTQIFIYMIRCKINGKVYVGQTQNPKRRMDEHAHNHHVGAFQSDIEEYGVDAFEWSIIAEAQGKFAANRAEAMMIERYGSTDPDKGYNIMTGDVEIGGATLGKKLGGRLIPARICDWCVREGCSDRSDEVRTCGDCIPSPERVEMERIAAEFAGKMYDTGLTPVEMWVWCLARAGYSNQEIGAMWGIVKGREVTASAVSNAKSKARNKLVMANKI